MDRSDPTNSISGKGWEAHCHPNDHSIRYEVRWLPTTSTPNEAGTTNRKHGWRTIVTVERLPNGAIAIMEMRTFHVARHPADCWGHHEIDEFKPPTSGKPCLLYTSDAADD